MLTVEQIKSRRERIEESDAFTSSEGLTGQRIDGFTLSEAVKKKQIAAKGLTETCYTVKEVAKKLNRTETTILRNIKSEKITASFDGSMYWIDKEWFETYMASLMEMKNTKVTASLGVSKSRLQ